MVAFTPPAILSDVFYGINLLTSLFNADIVGVFDNTTLQQVFANARPMRATIRETARVMEHPSETGVTLADHKIINPVEIEIPFIVPSTSYVSIYGQIKNAFINSTLFSIQTRVNVYSNMIIANMPHEEDADMYDAVTIALNFRQILYVQPNTGGTNANYAPKAPASANTIPSGLQSALSLTTGALTTASGVASYASTLKKFF